MAKDTRINKLGNALVETYGIDGYKVALARCQTSPRYEVLLAIAGHDTTEAWERLIRAAKKIAENPKTRAQLK